MIALGRLEGIPVVVAVGMPPVLIVIDDGWKRLEVGSHSVFVTVAVGNKLVKFGGFDVVVGATVVEEVLVGVCELVLDGTTIMLLEVIDSIGEEAVVVRMVELELAVGTTVCEVEVGASVGGTVVVF